MDRDNTAKMPYWAPLPPYQLRQEAEDVEIMYNGPLPSPWGPLSETKTARLRKLYTVASQDALREYAGVCWPTTTDKDGKELM